MGWESWTKLTAPADGDILAIQDVSDPTGDATGPTASEGVAWGLSGVVAGDINSVLDRGAHEYGAE